ncbi:MAG: saccharopine dehydrogenase [Flavobacteriales bacterium]|nr:saccharopine dehydrogenase [Flavobacteriales bacterium]|tara:strand:+ start:1214 stop:2467 length:1254 start_codon:yes stop_codon:yes gene_type:complete
MKTVLLLGVGRSTHTLIKYLINYSQELNIKIILADQSTNDFINPYIQNKQCEFVKFDINNDSQRKKQIYNSDLVVSMLPPKFHYLVAKDCILYKKNLITASYVSEEIQKLDTLAKEANILILNEIGLDPGIDHISAMDIIDSLKDKGAKINSFKSFCGGLIAPKSDNNPWGYKFTWNPKNVVSAGQSGASYLEDGELIRLTYKELFSNTEEVIIPNYGEFESYPNRDSMHYKNKYNLSDASTIVRGTLRKAGFCAAWDVFVQLGMTIDDSAAQIINKDIFFNYLKDLDNQDIYDKMNYLELFNNNNNYNSPFSHLLETLKKKWCLNSSDKDMIVMQHKFNYELNHKDYNLTLSMVVEGDDSIQTAMAKTVGLPVFFACKLILENKISLKGVRIPIYKEIYQPILKELDNEGIRFCTD